MTNLPSSSNKTPLAVSGFSQNRPGVISSNTPPQNSHWVGAEDWLEWSIYVDWDIKSFIQFTQKFKEIKTLKAGGGQSKWLKPWEVNGIPIHVSPSGARAGKGQKGIYFPYCIDYGYLRVLFSNQPSASKNIPNVIIRANGEACLMLGVEKCLNLGHNLLAELGRAIIRKTKLSRVDMALDMPGVTMDEFLKAFNEERFICRSKSIGYYKSTGFTLKFGESPMLVRIYDKLAEIMKRGNASKTHAMKMRRWGETIPESAVRVEFEIRRDALKQHGIDHLGDYFNKRADFVHYLTNKWIKFTADFVDRKNNNQSRAEVLPLWRDIQTAFKTWFGSPSGEVLEPLNLEKADVKLLFKQALGCIKTAARYQGKENLSNRDLLAYAIRGLRATSHWTFVKPPKKEPLNSEEVLKRAIERTKRVDQIAAIKSC